MKTVLITQRLSAVSEYPEIRECLDIRWAGFLNRCGIMPVALPIECSIQEYVKKFRPFGIILTGGNDMEIFNINDPLSLMRDKFENEIIKMAMDKNIPLFGVCRGMQMIAHFFRSSIGPLGGHVGIMHPVFFGEENMFRPIYGTTYEVNSYHQYCIKKPGLELVACAIASGDGSVEALQHRGKKLAAIMWHPERMDPFNSCDIQFVRHFFGGN
ncbi:MAG: gamma-glutamyl-gamma-aminobutyrate hydrolase family protein [bacterium]